MSKMKAKSKGEGLNETFNNAGLLLMNICHAALATWSVYDNLSVARSKNDLILTRGEKNDLDDVVPKLLNVHLTLIRMMDRRMQSAGIMPRQEGGAK